MPTDVTEVPQGITTTDQRDKELRQGVAGTLSEAVGAEIYTGEDLTPHAEKIPSGIPSQGVEAAGPVEALEGFAEGVRTGVEKQITGERGLPLYADSNKFFEVGQERLEQQATAQGKEVEEVEEKK